MLRVATTYGNVYTVASLQGDTTVMPLLMAACHGQENRARSLLARGADKDAADKVR